jgi:organic hydroperoxide reductase OsmC/OhrA
MRVKEFHFPLSVQWTGGRKVLARVEGKPPVEIATPPEFRGTDPETWSPEDFFVAAAASCLAVTFAGLAEREALPVEALEVSGDGIASMRADGRFGFTRLELRMDLDTDVAFAERARELAEQAERTCLVAVSLDLPVETIVNVRTPLAA